VSILTRPKTNTRCLNAHQTHPIFSHRRMHKLPRCPTLFSFIILTSTECNIPPPLQKNKETVFSSTSDGTGENQGHENLVYGLASTKATVLDLFSYQGGNRQPELNKINMATGSSIHQPGPVRQLPSTKKSNRSPADASINASSSSIRPWLMSVEAMRAVRSCRRSSRLGWERRWGR